MSGGGGAAPPARKLTLRRRLGLDRSGPDPPQTRPGQPLRPLTIPNMVGYLRLVSIPVFVVWAFSGEDGPPFWAAMLYWAIAAGDYLDGFLARATGQYSRMGALLDPVVDRLTVLSGAAVCWHFELLPRWALAILGARELITLLLAQIALRHGQPLEINWYGRIAVFPIMGSIFWSMVLPGVVWDVLLVIGVILASIATVVYARTGLRIATEPSTSG
jgi:CDP-diacylglycerol--glycerol-3-phosphate 3-phosphatidyltransferase